MEAVMLVVVVGAVAVGAVARWRGWPAPLLITAVALAASFLPFLPELRIDGHLLLNIVLPPLLYSAALDVSFVSFKRSMPQIRRLGIGLVLVTAVAVGLIAWLLFPDLTLPGALLLGAIVAPPDAVSAAAIGRRLGLPRRVMTVLSGESLINDATSLTLYRVFAAIVAGATLTVWDGLWQFLLAVVLGVGIGILFGVILHQLRMRIADPVVVGTFGLLVPFGAYAIAEHVGGSGVLAVVAMGLFVGYNSPQTGYATRLQERPLWLSADFLLESFVFAYIGLQFPRVLVALGSDSVGDVLLLAGVVLVVALLVRPAFVYPAYFWGQLLQRWRLRRWEKMFASGEYERRRSQAIARAEAGRGPGRGRGRGPSRREAAPTEEQVRQRLVEPSLTWRENAIISWAGMRGVVTLATALAAVDLAGLDEVASNAIVVVAFVVTVGTLMLQGLTLPVLIRWLGVADDESEREEDERQIAAVRERSRKAGMDYLRARREQWEADHGAAGLAEFDRMTARFARVEKNIDEAQEGADASGSVAAPPTRPISTRAGFDAVAEISRGWLTVRRDILREERDAGHLSEEVMRELIEAMDAEELALDARAATRPGTRA